MKNKEELNVLKEETEALGQKLSELTAEELEQVTGGAVSVYHVKKGDTLKTISEFLGVSMSTLVKMNGITNPDKIEIGTNLLFPC